MILSGNKFILVGSMYLFIFLISLGNGIGNHQEDRDCHDREQQLSQLSRQIESTLDKNLDSAIVLSRRLLQSSSNLKYDTGAYQACTYLGTAFRSRSLNDSALAYYRMSLDYAYEMDHKPFIMRSCRLIGGIWQRKHNKDSLWFYLKMARRLANELDDKDEKGNISLAMANYYTDIQELDSALFYYLDALDLFEATGNSKNAANALNNIGNMYLIDGQLDKSLDNFRKALKINQRYHNKPQISTSYNNMGIVFKNMENYDSAAHYYDKSRNISQELGDMGSVAINDYNLGVMHIYLSGFERAKSHFRRSMQLCDSIGLKIGDAYNYAGLGQLYSASGHPDSSIHYYTLAIQEADQFELNEIKYKSLENISYEYEKTGDYKQAFDHFEQYHRLRDSIFTREREKRLEELRTRYETEQKENKILLQQARLDQNEYELERRKLFIGILIPGLVVLVVFVVTILAFNRKLKSDNQKITRQAAEIRSANEQLKRLSDFKENMISMMVHDLKNPLNSIIGFSNLPPSEQNNRIMGMAGMNMYNLVMNILDVQKAGEVGMSLNKESLQIRELMKGVRAEVEYGIRMKEIELKTAMDDLEIMADKPVLHRVLVNLISNAIKYSGKNSKIHVYSALSRNNSELLIYVEDEGIGISADKLQKVFDRFFRIDPGENSGVSYSVGIGLTFCKMSIEAHGGHIGVSSKEGKGTRFWFSLPVNG